jgi:hypothetical protein
MADVGGASSGPTPTPVEVRGRGPSAWVALGLIAAALVGPLAPSVVTDALRFEATSGDAQYSVSEIAVFGRPAP